MLEFQDRTAAVGEDALLCRHLPLDVSSPLALETEEPSVTIGDSRRWNWKAGHLSSKLTSKGWCEVSICLGRSSWTANSTSKSKFSLTSGGPGLSEWSSPVPRWKQRVVEHILGSECSANYEQQPTEFASQWLRRLQLFFSISFTSLNNTMDFPCVINRDFSK